MRSMSFDQIEAEIARLAARGRDGKLSIEEMTGGTFTITNGSVFGRCFQRQSLTHPNQQF